MKYVTAILIAVILMAVPFAARAGDTPAARLVQSGLSANSCVPHNVAVEQLALVFNEKVVGLGLGKNQESVVELYVSSHGSWTILVTLTNGMSCIAASGENWTAPEGLAGLAS